MDLLYQKHRKPGSIVQIYMYKVMQDFYHQQYVTEGAGRGPNGKGLRTSLPRK